MIVETYLDLIFKNREIIISFIYQTFNFNFNFKSKEINDY